MKNFIVLLLALACCAGLLSGGMVVRYQPDSGFDIQAGNYEGGNF